MDQDAKKTALRMIPYGLYVLTARTEQGDVTAATVNWVTQASFSPPLVVVGVKADTNSYEVVSAAGAFALNVLGRGDKDVAFEFFKTPEVDDQRIGNLPYSLGKTGAPILEGPIASIECEVRERLELGDHAIVVGEVVDANVAKQPEGRADEATLHMADLGERTFYGG
jgi:flavin reductase (DIM6/NTAB) family NADH-FMN oxidoreductase RutF